jgi:hypothetical protein
MRKIMRATVHDHAPNTYYGQWPGKKALFAGLESPAIAHNELAASARFGTFDVPERDFPRNRSPPRWKFAPRPQRKICALGEAASLPATTGARVFHSHRTAGLQARIMIERIQMRV